MSIAYDGVLKRMREERLRLSLSQREVSRWVRMTQSNYSKVELGLRRLSYHEIKYLCGSDVDIHYIYTAQKCSGKYMKFFEQCNYSELLTFVGIIYFIAAHRYRSQTTQQWKNILEKVNYVPMIERNYGDTNIFLILRHTVSFQQKKMANLLGIDVKKLRDLENGRSLPDSELLSQLYELFQVPPAALLKDKKCMANEICVLLDLLDEENEMWVIDIIKKVHEKKVAVGGKEEI